MPEVSTVRLYALRLLYSLTFVAVGLGAWPALLAPDRPFGRLDGVAFSFWAAFSLLMGLGVRYPLQMLPLVLLQLLYKSVWLLAVALPLRSAGGWDAGTTAFVRGFAAAVVVDLLVIPWSYVVANYVRKPGDGSRFARGLGKASAQASGRT